MLLSTLALAIVWQPRSMQLWLVHEASARMALSTPYRLTVSGVTGNFFTRISFKGVQIKTESGDPVVDADAVRVSVRWHALLDKKIEIRTLTLIHPVLTLHVGADGKLRLPVMTPAAATPTSKPSEYVVSGDHVAIQDGNVTLIHDVPGAEPLHFQNVDADAKGSAREIVIDPLRFNLAKGSVEARGSVKMATLPTFEITLTTDRVALEQLMNWSMRPPEPLHLVHSGVWHVLRTNDEWNITEKGKLNQSPLSIEARQSNSGLFKAETTLAPIEVQRIWASTTSVPTGIVALHLTASGPDLKSYDALNLNGNLSLEQPLPSSTVGRVVNAEVHLADGKGPVLATCRMDGLQADVTTQLDLKSRQMSSAFTVSLSSFSSLKTFSSSFANAKGDLVATGQLSGPFDRLALKASLNAKKISYENKTIDSLDLLLSGGLNKDAQWTADVHAKEIVADDRDESPWDMSTLAAHASGPRGQWASTVDAKFRNQAVLHYEGTVSNIPTWAMSWDVLTFAFLGGPKLNTTTSGEAHQLVGGGLELSQLYLSDDANGALNIAHARWTSKAILLDGAIHHLGIAPFLRLTSSPIDLTGTLDGSVHAQGSFDNPTGSAELRLSSGAAHGLAFQSIHVGAGLGSESIDVHDLSIWLPGQVEAFIGTGQLPWHLVDAHAPKESIHMTLDSPHLDATFFTALIPGLVIDRGGSVSGHVVLSGLPPDIMVNGRITGDSSHINLKPAGLDLRSLVIDVESHDNVLTIHKIGGQTPKGPLLITGSSKLPDLNYTFTGHEAVINIPKMLQAEANFNLVLGGDLEGPDISGRLHLLEGTYTVPKPNKRKKGQEKTVDAQPSEPSPIWLGTTLDINAQWPRNVWYRDGLTKIETEGNLRVQKDENATTPYMSGRIGLVRGTYDAYGKDFAMDSGDIVFTGPPDINPVLNIRGVYQNPGATIYLDVTGTAKAPSLNFTANPPMSSQDIISVLVLGTPLSQIGVNQPASNQPLQPGQFYQSNQPGGTSPLGQTNQVAPTQSQSAELVAGNVIGGYISKGLRESGMDLLGLDVVRIDPGTEGNHLTVGRYIGSKLFVSYGQPLQGASSQLFNASYYITKRWTLEGQTGSSIDNFMDLIFRYPMNTPHHAKSKKEAATADHLPPPPSIPVVAH